jgi:hypothetical protein
MAAILILGMLFDLPLFAWEPLFEIRTKGGTDIGSEPLQKLAGVMDSESSVRIGIELIPGITIGYDSVHGVAMVFEF